MQGAFMRTTAAGDSRSTTPRREERRAEERRAAFLDCAGGEDACGLPTESQTIIVTLQQMQPTKGLQNALRH
jgi:hypothetical protein